MTRTKRIRLIRLIVGAAAFIIGLTVVLFSPEAPPPRPLSTAFYVWQLAWNDSVKEAVDQATPFAHEFMVLIGEVSAKNQAPTYHAALPDWSSLAKGQVPTTLVLRANVTLGDVLTDESVDRTSAYLAGVFKESVEAAKKGGVRVTGVQLDYDSPTSKLPEYRQLLERLRAELPQLEMSITVLPTWLKSWQFSKLVRDLSYYVLQVHSLEKPTTIDAPIVICNTSKISGYLRRASLEGTPFYIALPTYGYRVAFGPDGKFAALSAEGPTPAWNPGYQVKTIMTDPNDIADVVHALREAPPRECLGIAWFRMPVESDELNWTWETLEAVMSGDEPLVEFAVNVKTPQPGLYEVWISNTGEANVLEQLRIDVEWESAELAAHDSMRGFKATKDSRSPKMVLTGPAPKTGAPIQAAWLRLNTGDPPPEEPIKVTRVEIIK
ncbi:MAG: DUF3142 domain-containing protein [Candidatus Hydrogenedentes bacterium]|nr:DUF3142 domain-containing protein [Candidatus Hydrogenedentota bacterium]